MGNTDPDLIVEDDDFEENQQICSHPEFATDALDIMRCTVCGERWDAQPSSALPRFVTELPDGTFINHRGEAVCQYCGVAHQPDDPFLGCGM